MKKPKVDLIEGLSPAISIEQKNTSKNPRSTRKESSAASDVYKRQLFMQKVKEDMLRVCLPMHVNF